METEKEFNLLSEPWIQVIDADCQVHEVSLREALCQAHQYIGLKGELQTQDVAVLRLLLAVLHTVFSRVDANGNELEMEKTDYDGVWQELWRAGKLPEQVICHYLNQWEDRFWLFHPEYPFYQVKAAAAGTSYLASKLNGELSESSNKSRLFPLYNGVRKSELTYAQAARWLLYLQAYDDTSAKPKGKNLPSPGAGWLGKLGLIFAVGDNLFQTLMLNLVLVKNTDEAWGKNLPVWELPTPRQEERKEIAIPDNPAQLLTLQSRRILLQRENEKVVGYSLLGGDFFDKTLAVGYEPMTVWAAQKKGKQELSVFQPRRHNPSRQMWREFSSYFVEEKNVPKPGIVQWIKYLQKTRILSRKMIRFCITSVQYGDKDFFVTDVFSDALSFHLELLDEVGIEWVKLIEDEIDKCGKAAYQVRLLEENVGKASGKSAGKGEAEELFYARIDMPFRLWLESIEPDNALDTMAEKKREWETEVKSIARQLGGELIASVGSAAIIGREHSDNNEKKYYSAPEADNWFRYNLNKIYS